MDNYFSALFCIPKTEIDKKELRRELTVTSSKGFKGSLLVVRCYEDLGEYWGVPVAWALGKGYKGTDLTPRVEREWPKSDVKYIHNQEEVMADLLPALQKDRCCRLVAGTGFGKSIISVAVARHLKTNCLIVVPTNEILKQFISTAEDLFNIDVGIIKGAKQETDKTVVLTTYQTLSRRLKAAKDEGVELKYLDKFGLLVLDEAQLCGNASLLAIMKSVNARWRLGVSAQYYRGDGLEGVYGHFLGSIVAEGKKDPNITKNKVIWIPKLDININMRKCVDRFGDFSYVEYLNQLAKNKKYNEYIADLCKILTKNKDRRVLVGLKRLEQARLLKELLPKAGVFSGGTKKEELQKEASKSIILYTKSNLGLDMSKFLENEKKLIPLNTCICAVPDKNTFQLTGRVARENRGAVGLLILPQLDDFFSKSCIKKNISKNYKGVEIINSLKDIGLS